MDNNTFLIALLMFSFIAAALGYVIAALKSKAQISDLRNKYVSLNDKFDSQKSDTTKTFSNVEKMHEDLQSSLSELTQDQGIGQADITDKDRFVQTLLMPLQETLRSADQQSKRISREGHKVQRLIQQQLDLLKAPQQLGRGDVKQVTKQLGDADACKQWGLKTLKHLLELTYMTDHYRSCEPLSDGDSKVIPPCLISLPNGTHISVDPNTPLDAYVSICNAPDATVRGWHIETHGRKLRERILEQSSRQYLAQFKEQPTLHVLMILNDHYLATALEVDSDILDLAQSHNIVLATPTDLLNLFQTVSFGWRQQSFSQDAKEIRETGISLYKRFGTFIKLIAELGSELSGVLNSYNRAVSVFGNAAEEADKTMKAADGFQSPLVEETKKSA